jgi:sugar lactone lactonase YvrE
MAKAKAPAKDYELLDSDGVAWAIATLTTTRLNALLREYKRQEIYLTPRERISA